MLLAQFAQHHMRALCWCSFDVYWSQDRGSRKCQSHTLICAIHFLRHRQNDTHGTCQHLRSDMKQFTFLNTRNWYYVERTCFWISSSGSADSNDVRISYTAMHTQELFCNISLHGERTVSNHDSFLLQFRAKFCLLFTSTRLRQVSLGFPQRHAK